MVGRNVSVRVKYKTDHLGSRIKYGRLKDTISNPVMTGTRIPVMMSGPSRKELLVLYRQLLRSAESYPSKKRDSIYQAIREEWRENACMDSPDVIRRQLAVAYRGLSQLRQFDEMTMTGGSAGSPNWSVTLEQNPMPKPANYEEMKRIKK
jgi:LYR motif-containing protein 4